jgi:acyl-CoA synthetase (AMP-forming)/AMP-acid ligase II
VTLIGDGPRTIAEALHRRADRGGMEPALWFEALDSEPRELSSADLAARAHEHAARIAGRGVGRGDMVAIVLPTGPDFVLTFYGTLAGGAAAVPLYPPAGTRQVDSFLATVRRVVALSRPRLLVTMDVLADLLRGDEGIGGRTEVVTPAELAGTEPVEPAGAPRPDDLALVQFSSGSTGDPRGVALTHHNVVFNIQAFRRAVGIAPPDVGCNWLPLYHDMGLIGTLMGSLVSEIPLALFSPLDFLNRPSFWLETLARRRATIGVAPQFAYNLCVVKVTDEEIERLDLSSVRVLLNGAEPIDVDAIARFEERFAAAGLGPGAVTPCYGLAEHALCVSMSVPGEPVDHRFVDRDSGEIARPGEAHLERALKVASSGAAVEGSELVVVEPGSGERFEPLPDETIGEIAVRSESVCDGYLTGAGLEPAKGVGDWLRTGDLGFLSGGELFVVDRLKDLVIAAGRNVYPHDVEREVARLDGVRSRVAAFGVRNPALGTEGVVVAAESTLAERDELVRCATAIRRTVVEAFDIAPIDVLLLPKGRLALTSSGKVRRHRIRAEYQQGMVDDALYSLRGGAGTARGGRQPVPA